MFLPSLKGSSKNVTERVFALAFASWVIIPWLVEQPLFGASLRRCCIFKAETIFSMNSPRVLRVLPLVETLDGRGGNLKSALGAVVSQACSLTGRFRVLSLYLNVP